MRTIRTDWIGALVAKSLPVACKAKEALAAGDILKVTGVTGQALNVEKATSATIAGGGTKLLVTELAMADEASFRAFEWLIFTADTSSKTVGDRLYLTTAGDYTYTSGSNATPVGQVLSVGTSGKILLNPGGYPPAMAVVSQTVASTAAPFDFTLPFTVGAGSRFLVDVRTSTGTKRGEGTDTFTIAGGTIRVTYGGGAAPDIQVTDVITVMVFPLN